MFQHLAYHRVQILVPYDFYFAQDIRQDQKNKNFRTRCIALVCSVNRLRLKVSKYAPTYTGRKTTCYKNYKVEAYEKKNLSHSKLNKINVSNCVKSIKKTTIQLWSLHIVSKAFSYSNSILTLCYNRNHQKKFQQKLINLLKLNDIAIQMTTVLFNYVLQK